MKARKRAANDSVVGQVRFNLIKNAINRAHRAHNQGFYLEAISILESLMSDRIESHLQKTIGMKSQSTLGSLARKARDHKLIDQELAARTIIWSNHRSLVLHELVKVSDKIETSWTARLAFARSISEEGFELHEILSR